MIRRICAVGAVVTVAGGGLVVSGCGSSSTPRSSANNHASGHVTTLPSGQTLVEAADLTAKSPGYRLNAAISVKVGSKTVSMKMQGVVEQHGTVAALSANESVGGQKLDLQMRISHQVLYMTGIPGLSKETHGKRWLSFNVAQAEQAEGLGGLQTTASSNPAQFLDYLRAVGTDIHKVGTTTIGGDATSEYRATIELSRYAKVVPVDQRAAARQAIARLESTIGGRSLPVTVWVDARHRVRRMHLQIPECAQGHRFMMSMTMTVSDYGHVPPVTVPAASNTDDITSQLRSKLHSQPQSAGCSTSA